MTDWQGIARERAKAYGLDPAIVCAVCEQESQWNPWAIRYEPAFYQTYIVKLALPPTEARARAFSWGLGQVMGQTARELGYTGPLPELCDPFVGVDLACKKLLRCYSKCSGDDARALNCYNGGGNPNYSAEVLARVPRYR